MAGVQQCWFERSPFDTATPLRALRSQSTSDSVGSIQCNDVVVAQGAARTGFSPNNGSVVFVREESRSISGIIDSKRCLHDLYRGTSTDRTALVACVCVCSRGTTHHLPPFCLKKRFLRDAEEHAGGHQNQETYGVQKSHVFKGKVHLLCCASENSTSRAPISSSIATRYGRACVMISLVLFSGHH